MPSFSAAKPDSVANWNLYPIAPSSRWNAASWLSVRWRFQLNDGEQLYASSLPGYSRRIASENCFASARSGLAVSNHSMSAYGAYARARAIAASTPSLTTKNPSGERSPEGFFVVKDGVEAAIARARAYAPYADMLWFETAKPDLAEAKQFSEAILREYPGKLLAYNCSPSFN